MLIENPNSQMNTNNSLCQNGHNTHVAHNEFLLIQNSNKNFLSKLYCILENPEHKDIISWGDTNQYFLLKNINDFTFKIIPKYFKHMNYASFVRQLNIYNFNKTKSPNIDITIFQHKDLQHGGRERLLEIKKKAIKTTSGNLNEENMNNLFSSELSALQQDLNISSGNGSKKKKYYTKKGYEHLLTQVKRKIDSLTKRHDYLKSKTENLEEKNQEVVIINESLLLDVKRKK